MVAFREQLDQKNVARKPISRTISSRPRSGHPYPENSKRLARRSRAASDVPPAIFSVNHQGSGQGLETPASGRWAIPPPRCASSLAVRDLQGFTSGASGRSKSVRSSRGLSLPSWPKRPGRRPRNAPGQLSVRQTSAKNQYLLRGLIKCALCGLTYVGVAANRPSGKREFYYRCNGAHTPSVYSKTGRCHAKSVRGDQLEQQVWSDIESFLRNPKPVLEQLHARVNSEAKGSDQIRKQVTRLEGLLAQKATERSRVVGLYRRGRLTDADLDAQMDEIGKEETALEAQIAELGGKIAGADSIAGNISSAQALLAELRKRLNLPVSWEQKRRLIDVLVAGVRVETVEESGVKQTRTTVTYRFSQPDQPMPLVLPQSYSTGQVIRIPVAPQTVGDHIRKRRLGLKMLQKDVAEQLGVDKTSVFNWEANTAVPAVRYMPAIIQFLGYDPLPVPKGWGEQLVRHRTTLGMTQKEAARGLGVDQGTLAKWEQGKREPQGAFLVIQQLMREEERRENQDVLGPLIDPQRPHERANAAAARSELDGYRHARAAEQPSQARGRAGDQRTGRTLPNGKVRGGIAQVVEARVAQILPNARDFRHAFDVCGAVGGQDRLEKAEPLRNGVGDRSVGGGSQQNAPSPRRLLLQAPDNLFVVGEQIRPERHARADRLFESSDSGPQQHRHTSGKRSRALFEEPEHAFMESVRPNDRAVQVDAQDTLRGESAFVARTNGGACALLRGHGMNVILPRPQRDRLLPLAQLKVRSAPSVAQQTSCNHGRIRMISRHVFTPPSR